MFTFAYLYTVFVILYRLIGTAELPICGSIKHI